MESLSHRELGPHLTLEEAMAELKTVRRQAGVLRERSAWLRDYIDELGGNPDADKPDLAPRNAEIYWLRKNGLPIKIIAEGFQLSPGTVSLICQHVAFFIKHRRSKLYKRYKDLLDARDMQAKNE